MKKVNFVKPAVVSLLLLAAVCNVFAQTETQNPTFPFWKVRGNAGTHTGTNFIGTTDNFSLAFRTNNAQRMVIDSLGRVGIGTSAPIRLLHIGGVGNTLRIGGLGTGGSFISIPAATTDKLLFTDANGDLRAVANGSSGQVLTINGSGTLEWGSASGSNWSTTGNSGTNAATNFLGTTDAADLAFRVNNIRAGLLEHSTTGNTFYGFKAGEVWTNGNSNVLIGTRTAEGWDGGDQNTMLGAQAGAGFFGVVRNDNTLIGYRAGYSVDMNGITAIGSQAGYSNRNGRFNTYLGFRAGYTNESGFDNVFVGDSAGLKLDIFQCCSNDNQNIFVGSKAGRDVEDGSDNTLMGYMTGMFQQGNGNTLVGSQAASGIFGGVVMQGNTAVGYRAGYNTFVGQNTFVGYMAGFNNRNATSVTAIGYGAGFGGSSNNGSNSVFVGDSAGYDGGNSGYYENTFVGSKAGRAITSGNNNVALGFRAMSNMFNLNANVSNTVAIGSEAGHESGGANNSVFIGYRSGYSGFNNDENIFVGAQTGSNFNNLHQNIFVGNNLLITNSSNSDKNVIVGYQAIGSIQGSDENIVIGNSTNAVMQSATQNVVIGPNITSVNNAQNNVAVGNAVSFSSSQNSTFLGSGATSFSNVNNATALGANTIVSQDNTVILGNGADVGIGTSTPARKLHVSGSNNGVRFEGVSSGGTYIATSSSTNNHILYADNIGDLYGLPGGSTGQVLTYTTSGPAWSSGSGNAWNTTGNSGTDIGTNFIGTTDVNGLRFKVNSIHAGLLDIASFNSLYGVVAGSIITSGIKNTYIGFGAGMFSTTGANNTYLGFEAGKSTNIGLNNVAVGIHALQALTTTSKLIAIGDSALFSNTIGPRNTAIGSKALFASTVGADNTALGYNTLLSNIGGNRNVAIGSGALQSNTSGTGNAAVGVSAAFGNTTGHYNVAIGQHALFSNTTLSRQVAIGDSALYNNTGGTGLNTAIGTYALLKNTTGERNTTLGYNSGHAVVTTSENTIVGYNAVSGGTTIGANNTVLGSSAAVTQEMGDGNVLVGYNVPANSASMGNNNLIAGTQAGNQGTTGIGDNNVLLGYQAGLSMSLNQASNNNVIIGNAAQTLDPTFVGVNNSIIIGSGATNAGSFYNTVIGSNAKSVTSATNTTVIGSQAQVTMTNNLILGDTTNRPQVGIGVTAVGKTLVNTRFEIASEGANDNILYRYQGTGTPTFNFQRALGTLNAPTVIGSSSSLGILDYYAYDGNSWEHAASIGAYADSTVANAVAPGRISFSTRSSASSFAIERMRLDRNGYLGIGTTDPDTRLVVNGGVSVMFLGITITTDNQSVTVGDRTYLLLLCSVATPSSATVVLTNGLEVGQLLIITAASGNSGFFELVDENTQAGTNMQTGLSSITMGAQDSATFIWDGTDWIMLSQRNNN